MMNLDRKTGRMVRECGSGSAGRSRKSCYGRGFTLIELLAVMGIMALILVIALPAFDAFKLRSTQTAVPQLISTLRLARQHAITHREDVYVVFPDRRAPNYSPVDEVDKALCSYAVIAINRETTNYITEWKYLPKGIYFNDDPALLKSVFSSYKANVTDFPFPNDRGSVRNLCAVQFRPNGKAYSRGVSDWDDGSVAWIPLTSAYVEVNTNTGTVTVFSNLLVGVTNIVRIRKKTGQIDFKRDADD